MKLFTVPVTCPVCGTSFKGHVLSEYHVEGYTLDFKPLFENGEKLLKYFLWFCPACHYAGYDNRFSFGKNSVSLEPAFIEAVMRLPKKSPAPLPYRFYRAGEIGELMGEKGVALMDYFLKSYWAAKDMKKKEWVKKSSQRILELAEQIYEEAGESEDLFIALYLAGTIYYEQGNMEEAAFQFSRMMRIKTIPTQYEKQIKFALDFLKGHKNEG